MALPLTKTLDPAQDYPALAEELVVVDRYFHTATPQHEHRRFEYALALRACRLWKQTSGHAAEEFADVGGAGSPFKSIVGNTIASVTVIDPALNNMSLTLAEYLLAYRRTFEVVTCLSVLEHVEDLPRFLYHLSCLVAPGGLLFLTMDACDDYLDDWPIDTYHFHWMRKRIFNGYGWRLGVAERLIHDHHFRLFGDADWTYHGNHLYGSYSFASLALIKEP